MSNTIDNVIFGSLQFQPKLTGLLGDLHPYPSRQWRFLGAGILAIQGTPACAHMTGSTLAIRPNGLLHNRFGVADRPHQLIPCCWSSTRQHSAASGAHSGRADQARSTSPSAHRTYLSASNCDRSSPNLARGYQLYRIRASRHSVGHHLDHRNRRWRTAVPGSASACCSHQPEANNSSARALGHIPSYFRNDSANRLSSALRPSNALDLFDSSCDAISVASFPVVFSAG
jgi:hypothetical protein